MLSLFAALVFAVGVRSSDVQVPDLQECSTDEPDVIFQKITISNAVFGELAAVITDAHLRNALDSNPILRISLTTSIGVPLPCVPTILQCNIKLCGGTSQQELEVNQDWNNTCPINTGDHIVHLTVNLMDNVLTRLAFGNGDIIVTVKVENGGKTVGCVRFPAEIDMSL